MRSRNPILAVALAALFVPGLAAAAAKAPAGAKAPAPAKAPAAAKDSAVKTTAAPANLKLKVGAAGTVCLDCHVGSFEEVLKKPFVHTPVKSRNCIGCHNPHGSDHGKLLSAQGNDACTRCHAGTVPKEPKSTHKPVGEKGCVACHDPHASANKFNLIKPARELCASCHKPVADAAAKAKFKHKPIEQGGCTACHDPHGSAKGVRLLKDDLTALCLGCHDVKKPLIAQKHLGYPVGKARCTSCHDPHGSDKRGMLYNTVHPPVAKGQCALCHEPAGSPNALQTRAAGVQLCRGCHATKLTAMFDKAQLHRPVAEGNCLACHGPHASAQKGLIKGNMVAVCGTCHADTIKRQQLSPTKHEPVQNGDCSSCHDPHGSDAPLMFVKGGEVVEMCGSCHDWLKHSSHPMGEKIKDPRNKNLTVQCLSCHRSHGTEYKHMMPYATTSDLCTKCHENFKR